MDSATPILATRDIAQKLRDHRSALNDKLGLLSDSLAHAVAACAEELRSISGTNLSLSVAEVAPGRLDDIPGALGAHGLLATYAAGDGRDKLLIGLSSDLIRIWVEALFGGDGSEHTPSDARPCSTSERQAAQVILEQINAALSDALQVVGVSDFVLERTDAVAEAPERSGAAIRATITMQIFGYQGTVVVGVPAAHLNPPKPELSLGKPLAPLPPQDPYWSKRIEAEIKRADIEVQAVIEEARTLAEVAGLQVGQILPLQAKPGSHLKLECNGRALFWCELGQGDGNYIVRVNDAVYPPEDAHP